MVASVPATIDPQKRRYNIVSVEYSAGVITFAKNMDIAINNTNGN